MVRLEDKLKKRDNGLSILTKQSSKFSGYLATAALLSSLNSSGVTLAWQPSPDADVCKYRLEAQVFAGPKSSYGMWSTNVYNPTNGECFKTINNLLTNRVYVFRVFAQNTQGAESEPSNEVIFLNGQTKDFNPSDTSPPNLSITNNPLSIPSYNLVNGTNTQIPTFISSDNSQVRVSGLVSDQSFIDEMELFGPNNFALTNYSPSLVYSNVGGIWHATLPPTLSGTNTYQVVARDFKGLSSTNTFNIISLGRTPKFDSDNDGVPDYLEIARGYNPLDPSDGFKTSISRGDSDNVLISAYMIPGQNFTLMGASDLGRIDLGNGNSLSPWSPIATKRVDTPGVHCFIENVSSSPAGYRTILPEYDFKNLK